MAANFNSDTIEFKENLPLLPIRDNVIYPFMLLPLFVGRESTINAIEDSMNKFDKLVFLASQKDIQNEKPSPDDIYEVGTIAMIVRMKRLPDGRAKILVQGLCKARIVSYTHTEPYYQVKLEKIENKVEFNQSAAEAMMRIAKEKLEKIISISQSLSPDILMVLEDIDDPGRLADLIASNLNLKVQEAQQVLELIDPLERLKFIDQLLARELGILSMQHKLRNHNPFDPKSNPSFRDTLKNIKTDGQEEAQDEFAEMRLKLKAKNLPTDVEKEVIKQLSRLERMHPDSSESNILRGYIEWVNDLPWTEKSEEITDLDFALKTLNEDHYDLKHVKERILEYLAVRTLKKSQVKGPILCFSGPPGVGKTSLGKSIAKATGREFVRISLGGVKDESEIRGHRRTYVGSMPGRFIQAMKQAKTINPVILLDEIDKLGSDYKGDPSSALLEVLDPEQNFSFRDNYLNLPYDLSQVMFIATSNVLENIPAPLRDRMEIIDLAGYTQEEKLAISKKYLVPKQIEENGLNLEQVEFSDEALLEVIKSFTREAGLRNLERQIGALCRKVAKKVALGLSHKTVLLEKSVEELLGPSLYSKDDRRLADEVGVVTGLAWTSAGGEILHVEATKMKGRGLTLTGKLGDVMKESAQAALGFIRSHARELGIDESIFENNEIHIHLPAGAVPKDGPSAGITLATAMISLLTDSMISKDIAMTGEMTLTGKVLPVGGIKEKALAALRTGITNIIIPWKNIKDLQEIPDELRKKVNFIPVKNIMEVVELALIDWDPSELDQPRKKFQKKKKRSDSSIPEAA
jgi:ATP-dependent Lon protease